MKHGLIFDLDGTLIDSLTGIAGSLNRALDSLGLPGHPREAVRRFIGNGSRVLAARGAPAGAEEALVLAIEHAFKADYDATWAEGSRAYEGIPELLEELATAGSPLAVLSNKPHAFVGVILATLFPGIHFSAVLGQRGGIPHKPDPAGAYEIAAELALPPVDCVLIGDSTIDLATARNAGMSEIAVTWGYHDREILEAAGAVRVAHSVEDLRGMLLPRRSV